MGLRGFISRGPRGHSEGQGLGSGPPHPWGVGTSYPSTYGSLSRFRVWPPGRQQPCRGDRAGTQAP